MKTAALILGVVLISGIAYAFMPEQQPTVPMPETYASWDEKVEYWKQEIGRSGGATAYQTLSAAIQDKPYTAQHTLAHAFGSALFAVEGADGIAVCDDRFSFGCSHQFLGDAIASLGLGSIEVLNDACFNAMERSPLSCQHGMGHGILTEIGYEFADLETALDTCSKLSGTDPIGGCYSGVFMEYNIRTMLLEAATPREFTGNIIEPCDKVDEPYRAACFYWQPQWWLQALLREKPPAEKYETMGQYCRTYAHTTTHKRACFEGLGNVVAQSSNFVVADARELCIAAGETAAERLLCLSVAANHFGIDVSGDAGRETCESLAGEEEAYCLLSARNAIKPGVTFPLEL